MAGAAALNWRYINDCDGWTGKLEACRVAKHATKNCEDEDCADMDVLVYKYDANALSLLL